MPYNKKFENTLYNKLWLENRYIKRKMSAKAIAEELGCRSSSSVLRKLRQFKIKVRTLSEAQKLAPHPGSHAPRPKKNKDTLHNEAWLRKAYKKKNASDIAKELGCAVPVVIWALNKFGIKTKGISEAKKGRPSIMKGRIDPDARSNTTLGRRARDACMEGPCLVCGSTKSSIVSHIDRNRENNDLSNLERLCYSCHARHHHIEGQIALELLIKEGNITRSKIHKKVINKILTIDIALLGEGYCSYCGFEMRKRFRLYKDGNEHNKNSTNVDIVCSSCYMAYLTTMDKLALKLCLKKTKYTILDIHRKARKRLLKQWENKTNKQ